MELIKIRQQPGGPKTKPSYALDIFRKVYQAEGVRGLYRGMTSTVLREIPAFGVYFVTYEYLCRTFAALKGSPHCPTYGLLVAGGCAGCSSWLANYPIDVIKTRYQVDGDFRGGQYHYRYNGYMDCIRQSLSEGGYRVLFRGLGPTLSRAFVVNAATFPVYTLCIRYLKPRETEEEMRTTLERSTMLAQRE